MGFIYRFTDDTRTVLAQARMEAEALGHAFVGPEHILLGLWGAEEGGAARALRLLGIEQGAVRHALYQMLRPAKSPGGTGDLPYTSRAKRVLELAMAAAYERQDPSVGSEDLLLGIVREQHNPAAQVLLERGGTPARVREAVARVRSGEMDRGMAEWEGVAPKAPERRPAGKPAERRPAAGTRGGHPAPAAAERRPAEGAEQPEDVWYLELDPDGGKPIYEQIIASIEEAVATGQLAPGERLPTVRELAAELGIAPGTVARAYSRLEESGVVRTDRARGTSVADAPPVPARPAKTLAGLERLLRRTVVAAFHRGATAQHLRDALERAMSGILRVL